MSEPTFAEGYWAANDGFVKLIRKYFPSLPLDVKIASDAVVFVVRQYDEREANGNA
jgi:hypothetical protein